MWRIAILAALSLPWLVHAQSQSLLEVYAKARAADPVLALADAQRGVQRERGVQTRAGLLPQWSLQATNRNEVTSTISQVLVDLGQIRRMQAADALNRAQDASLRAAEQALCARVATAYFGVLSAQAGLTTAQSNEAAFAQQVDQAQKRYHAGLSALVDVEQARTYHALARGTAVQAGEALQDARGILAEITGQMPGPLQPLAAHLQANPPVPQNADAWVTQALNNNATVQAQHMQLDASERDVGAASAGHWPTLGLTLDSQRQGGDGAVAGVDSGRFNTTLTLRLNVPLFAGGATQSQTRQALHQREAVRHILERAKRTVVRETQAQYQAVLAGVALVDSTGTAVEAANRALAATRAGQTLGTRGMTDLLLAIQTQAAAHNAFTQARHRYVLATLLLQQAAGALDEGALATVDQLLQGDA